MYEYGKQEFLIGNSSTKPVRVSDVNINDLVYELSQDYFHISEVSTQKTNIFCEEDIKFMKSGTFEKDKNQVDTLEKYILKGTFSHDSDDPDNDTIKFTIILEDYEQTHKLVTVKSVKCTVKGEADFTFPVSERLPHLSKCLQTIYVYKRSEKYDA